MEPSGASILVLRRQKQEELAFKACMAAESEPVPAELELGIGVQW